MPIHLAPQTRRQFLTKSILAGAGLAWGGRSPAAEAAANPDLWALLADTHIDANRATMARGINMADHLMSVVGQVSRAGRLSGAIIAGDCAYLRGLPGDYDNLLGLLEPIRARGLPVHLLLGNHDDRDNFRAAMRKAGEAAKSPLPEKLVSLLPTPRANLFLLDSLDKVNGTPGLLGEVQLAWLARELDAHEDRPAIIIGHHNPEFAGGKNGLQDTAGLMETLVPRKHAKALIFAHTHVWDLSRHESGIHLINLPPVAYVFKEGRLSGWVLMALREGGATLTLRSVDGMHPDEGKSSDIAWRT